MLSVALLCLMHVSESGGDGGSSQDPGTALLEAAQSLSPPDAGFVATTSDFRTLEDVARAALARHQRLVALVPNELPKKSALAELLAARELATTAATRLRASFSRPPSTLQVQQMSSHVDALTKADLALDAKLRSVIDELQPTAVVVSGGVSLGAYQAGLLHYYSQYLLQHRVAVAQLSRELAEEPMVATGASAGSVNAFLSAVSTCRKPVKKPEESLFWQVWMPVGFEGLLKLDDVTTYSILSRAPLDKAVKVVEDSWNDDGWDEGPCRLNVGFTVTREVPRSISLNTSIASNVGQVRLPIQTERVLLTLEGSGSASPGIRSVRPTAQGEPSDFYVDWDIETKEGDPFPTSVAKILQASSAFPIAWPPVLLELNEKPSRAYFLDGGVFDNNPVRLAIRLLEWTGPGEKKLNVAQTRLRTRSLSRILYVEPDATSWGEELAAETERRSSFLSMYAQLASSLVGTARKAELVSTLEYDESDTLRDRIDVPLRSWPITGSFMLNFFAFLEEDFRRFDFYSGMADAHEFLARTGGFQRLGLANMEVVSPEFDCVLAFRRAEGTTPASDLWECKYLFLQSTTLTPAQKQHSSNLLALLDSSAEVRAAIFDCIGKKSCKVGAEFETLSTALPKHGFVFSDKTLESATVIGAVRDRLHPFISRFARAQPFPESATLAVVGKAALDSIAVRPSSWFLGAGMHSRSGFEFEYSKRLVGPWRPLTFGLRVLRIQSRFLEAFRLVAEERYSASIEGYWHPLMIEGGLQWLTPKWPFWLRLGASAGLGFEVTTLEFSPATYRFPASAALTATLLQRIYLRLAVRQYLFDACPNAPCGLIDERRRADIVQLASIRTDWLFSVGWRWID